jgi:MFS family permease
MLAGVGLLLFARAPVEGSYLTDILPVMLLLGGGAGLAFPALMTLAMSGATQSDAGLASGLVNTTVQVGGAIGLAVLATLATERTHGLLADGESSLSALNAGYHLAYLIGAALIVGAIAAATIILDPRAVAEERDRREAEPARSEPAYSEAG